MTVRFARAEDAPALLSVYAQYIDTPVTLETELPSAAEFRGRIEEISSFYPYLVLEEEGKIVGYAYAHRQMERAAYGWNAELSVYLDGAHLSRGIGKKLGRRASLARHRQKTVFRIDGNLRVAGHQNGLCGRNAPQRAK